jgi:hypothetical protein
MTKSMQMMCLLLSPLFRKSGVETIDRRRLWLSPSLFQAKKVRIIVPILVSVLGRRPPASGQDFKWREGIETICHLSYLLDIASVDLFLFPRGKVGTGCPLAVPGQLQDELG